MHTDNNARSNAAVFVVEKKTKEVIQTIKRDQTPPHLCLKEHQIRYYHESCEKLKTIILYMGKIYCIPMADFLGNFLSNMKQNIPYLKDHDVSSEVIVGALMHLFLILCFIILFYLLVRKFM